MTRIRFNSLLEAEGINPRDVGLVLHTPEPSKLRQLLPIIVRDRPDLLMTYQSVHSAPAERTLKNRKFAASFVCHPSGRQTFAGLFRITSKKNLPTRQIFADPRFQELEFVYGATDTAPAQNIARAEWQTKFEMMPLSELKEYIGRVQIAQPKGRAYVRIASNLDPDIVALSADDLLVPAVPDWQEMIVGASLIRALPDNWAARLREWRGVYLIVDESDGARYVGSAYGKDNLLGRWRVHVSRGHGVTKELKRRDPMNFRFSIVQLVSPDASPDEVVTIEQGWMNRLHTREFGLNA